MKNLFFTILILFSIISFGQNTAKRTKQYNIESTLAIQGYDPVAYFKANKAIKGKKDLSYVFDGITYHFASKENKDEFQKSPQKYEPQYGGWCAYAMGSSGDKVEINPETFKIIDGKLYLFYNAFFNNTLKSWNKDEKGLKAKADTNWKKIIN
ncbi:YHS domain-containing (seleno)protein [Flavobacterium sp. H122]|uniref:YHS domain-containing (seleno)protein n=1 Tax=Flavobacterium sp. H122 TaxID=2529860 RepID=UPI0010AAAF5B|nr:YHS domain-containing (seleno)protein [Flavobacterium sp. H122]